MYNDEGSISQTTLSQIFGGRYVIHWWPQIDMRRTFLCHGTLVLCMVSTIFCETMTKYTLHLPFVTWAKRNGVVDPDSHVLTASLHLKCGLHPQATNATAVAALSTHQTPLNSQQISHCNNLTLLPMLIRLEVVQPRPEAFFKNSS